MATSLPGEKVVCVVGLSLVPHVKGNSIISFGPKCLLADRRIERYEQAFRDIEIDQPVLVWPAYMRYEARPARCRLEKISSLDIGQ
jgi:hypothetical protein